MIIVYVVTSISVCGMMPQRYHERYSYRHNE